SRTLTEQKAEENLRERYINIVKQIDAGIVEMEELRDTRTLQEELEKLLHVRPNIVMVDIFDLTSGTIVLTARKSIEGNQLVAEPDINKIEAVQRGEVLTSMERNGTNRYWNIMAPVRIRKDVSGLIRAKISTKEFDDLVIEERRQAFMITATAALAILIFLVWYLRRTVSKPIAILNGAMAQAEAGDLKSQVKSYSRDEIGMLTQQFNQMIARIRNFNDELAERVQQATEELNHKYNELISLNQRLSETQIQLAQSERLAAAGQVAAAIAHSIGTPLHSILGHLHRLKRDTSDAKREERLKIIHTQVERVVQIIQDLLDTVRKPVPNMLPVRINKLLDELLYLIAPGISLRGINVITSLDPLLPDIEGDVNQLQELFLNLLTNAMDAMPDGGELEVNTGISQNADSNNDSITITIRDSGRGVDEANLKKIFEPFFTTKERSRGTGLGLSICRDIAKTHHGEIYVSSQVGKGTSFTTILPVKRYEKT
ncbi:MAG: HAMP domain-containing protein, partial [Nitrospirae bacterium]|nr:HAMP domain-containing protein [Nitrospirota bacterium]